MRYHYTVVRYVPDSFRGEFVNVAVIVSDADRGEWRTRRVGNTVRARNLGAASISAVWEYMDGVDSVVAELSDDSSEARPELPRLDRDWMREEAGRLHNVVQVSPPQAVVADDVDEAVEKVFSTFVVDPGPQRRNTRTQAIATLREAYLRALPSRELVHEKVVGRIGRQRLDVDFAVANGYLAQLSHAWSFRAQNTQATVEKIKAWSWTLRDIREGGGTISVSRREEPYILSGDVPVEVIYDEPTTDLGKRSLDESLEVFGSLEVRAIEAERVALVASDALRSLAEHEPPPQIRGRWRRPLGIEPPGD